jgi:hypothetical protein
MTSSLAAPELTIAPQVPPSRPVSRWLVAAFLVAGATLQLIEELIEPPIRDDGDRLEWIAGHSTLHAVDIAIGLAAVPLLMASVLLLARLAGRMHGLARVGASICVVGFSGLAAVHGFEFAEVALLDAGVPPATVAAAAANVQPVVGIPMLGMFLGALNLGLPLLLVALWISRGVPRGAIVVCFVFMIVDFVGPELPLPSHALSFVAFTWMAAAIALGRGAGFVRS